MTELQPTPRWQKTTRLHRSLSLQRKFLLGVGVIFLGFCLIIALAIYSREKSLLAEAAHEKAEMVMAAAEATRSYVLEVLRPRMYEALGHDAFLLEAMSTSYVSRSVMDRLKDTMPEYQIRRVALHARNPASDPKPFEVKLIKFSRPIPMCIAGKASSGSPASPVSSIPARSISPWGACIATAIPPTRPRPS